MRHHIKKTARITKKIVHSTLAILVIMLLPFVVFTLVTANTNFLPNMKSYVVISGSMQPTLPVGSITYTQKVSHYNIGDIITFTDGANQTVTHRVVGITQKDSQRGYITKGDANNVNDQEVIQSNNIRGKVIFLLPYIGYLIKFLKTPLGFTLGIVLPTILLVLFELWNLKNEFVLQAEKKLLEKLKIHE